MKIPEHALASILSRKFEEAGIIDFAGAARAASRHLFAGRSFEEFEWDDPCDSVITLTEEDLKEVQKKIGKLIEELPGLTKSVIESVSIEILERHRKEWLAFRRHEERQLQAFRINLEERWGAALDGLRLLHSNSLTEGENFADRLSRSRAKAGKLAQNVVLKLHIRGCQVAAEILTLLENGFADGAMARWRTLHEITTVAYVIDFSPEETAARYLDHEVVDAKRALDTYLRVHDRLGYKPPTKREVKGVDREFAAAIKRHGKSFGTPFGWASTVVGNPSPRFSDLEELSGRAAMRSHYKLASYDVHASPRALSHRIGLLDSSMGPVAGATNAGLEEAGQITAFTLTQLTLLVLKRGRKIDSAIAHKMLVDLRDSAADAFASAADQLRTDDADVRAALKDQFGEDAPDFSWG